MREEELPPPLPLHPRCRRSRRRHRFDRFGRTEKHAGGSGAQKRFLQDSSSALCENPARRYTAKEPTRLGNISGSLSSPDDAPQRQQRRGEGGARGGRELRPFSSLSSFCCDHHGQPSGDQHKTHVYGIHILFVFAGKKRQNKIERVRAPAAHHCATGGRVTQQ